MREEDEGRCGEKAAGQTEGKDRGPLQLWQFQLQRLGTPILFSGNHFLEVILARVFYTCHIEKTKHQPKACCLTVGLQHVGAVSLHTTDE